MTHILGEMFQWPAGIVVGNLIASAMWAAPALTHLHRKINRHHREAMRTHEKDLLMTSYTTMIDATGVNARDIPASTTKIAGYVTGSGVVPWTAADWALFPAAGHVRIDQSPTLAAWATAADVADMETGAATEGAVISQGLVRQAKGWWSTAYVSSINLAGLQGAAKNAGLTKIQYWVANWNLSQDEAVAQLGGDVVAVQWASPTSNPGTIVPGSTKTLAEANVDLSVTVPAWFAYRPPVPVVTKGVVVTDALTSIKVSSTDLTNWSAA